MDSKASTKPNQIRTITHHIPGAQRVMLTLRLQSGDNVCVSLFDSMALAFHNKFDAYGKEPKVVLATSVNPKIVGDKRVFNYIFFVFTHGFEEHAIYSLVQTGFFLIELICLGRAVVPECNFCHTSLL
ncbi:unnamed protein product [Brassica napus]|uniref:(rape) hypothetical protein n=1 Tax=Brassica napus TaxID=3708 RepID=A0A816K580_BRANA|nr:unnamed protein product [Brassica napus]